MATATKTATGTAKNMRLLSQHPLAKVADILKFLASSEFIKVYSNAEAVTDAFLNVVSKSEREFKQSHGG